MCRAAFFASQKMLLSSARHMNSLTAVAHAARHRYARGGVLRTHLSYLSLLLTYV